MTDKSWHRAESLVPNLTGQTRNEGPPTDQPLALGPPSPPLGVPSNCDETAATRLAAQIEAFTDERDGKRGRAAGEAVSLAYASRARGERKRPSSGWSSLTPTEARVVELVTEGLTNPQIAEKMFIASGTVKVHLSHVFAKLGVSTRTELTRRALDRAVR